LPVPLVGEAESHVTFVVTTHGTFAVTETPNEPEAFPTDCEVDEMANELGAACVTVTVRVIPLPVTVTTPERAFVVVFA